MRTSQFPAIRIMQFAKNFCSCSLSIWLKSAKMFISHFTQGAIAFFTSNIDIWNWEHVLQQTRRGTNRLFRFSFRLIKYYHCVDEEKLRWLWPTSKPLSFAGRLFDFDWSSQKFFDGYCLFIPRNKIEHALCTLFKMLNSSVQFNSTE